MPKRPTIDQAKAFCEVADNRSYVRAGERLEQTRMSVIRLVGRFAESVERGELFTPSRRGEVDLTAAGRELLPAARRFVAAADALTDNRAEIRFSAYPSIVQQVMTRCPDLLEAEVPMLLVDVSEESRGDGGRGLVSAVSSGRLDLVAAPSRLLSHKELEIEGLQELFLYSWQLRVVVPEGHGFEAKDALAPAQLAGLQIGAAPAGHRSRALLEAAFAAAGTGLEVALESDSPEMLHSVARHSNLHVAIIPDDSFGASDEGLGPSLTDGSRRCMGGDYSLYLRDLGLDGRSSPAGREVAVTRVATTIRAALGDVQPSS